MISSHISPKLRKAAHGKPCIRCGVEDGTVCGRHYAGLRQHRLGKGRGMKAHDFAQADLCIKCDSELSEGAVAKGDFVARTEHSEEWLFLCLLTLIRRHEEGVLVVKGERT